MSEMFEKAARLKLRFDFRGMLSAEDLWDLALKDLDTIYKALSARAKFSEDSLMQTKTRDDEEVALKIEIVKYVFAAKLAEKEAREKAAERREKKQKLLEVLEQKQNSKLQDMSEEDLQKMISEL
jgi:hypothetical protein